MRIIYENYGIVPFANKKKFETIIFLFKDLLDILEEKKLFA